MINAAYGIRFILMLCIWGYHIGLNSFGGYMVTTFIIMSGWFAMYTLHDKDVRTSEYIIKKFRKFFPSHFVAFILSIPFEVELLSEFSIYKRLAVTLLYNTFTQSWIPQNEYYFAYNAVEWTLSTLFFAWLCTPYLIRYIKKVCISTKHSIISMAIIYVVEIVVVSSVKNGNGVDVAWALSVNPVFRLLDYTIGILLCNIMLLKRQRSESREIKQSQSFIFEIAAITLWIAICILTKYIRREYLWSLVYTPVSVIILHIFLQQKSWISTSILGGKVSVFLGKISYEFYLFHMLAMKYLEYFNCTDYNTYAFLSLISSILFANIVHIYTSRW